jgi:hypothetical protein
MKCAVSEGRPAAKKFEHPLVVNFSAEMRESDEKMPQRRGDDHT